MIFQKPRMGFCGMREMKRGIREFFLTWLISRFRVFRWIRLPE